MKNWRAFWAAFAIWAFLGWCYVCARIIYGVDPFDEFISGIPVSFYLLGIGWYVIGLIATWRALCCESP